ncbi:methyltransferase domain-containing protein [Microbacteriaceae bacterium VKM Ac-2854]|nr:methyltransferase domain-containing protein [Microbacteriaceae bacterium VKM Ac-2854]
MVSVNADGRRTVRSEEREPIVLVDRESAYRDGAEQVLIDLVSSATDISSTSDEMLANAVDWPQIYHVDPARANVLRALDLPADAVALEIGSGCGAITRYLGETVAHVDAIEPVLDRARVGRLRTRDLENVEVYVGQVQDLPDEERYDLVVVVGVLEYVGGGSADPAAYLDFLAACRSRLKPGGTLIIAIENRFGVKYLAGAPEDHYGLPYVGVDGYPQGELARTFSRHELGALLDEARFGSRSLIAFPDYKLTRTVLDPDRLEGIPAQELLAAVPTFPSPDWVGTRAEGADERRLWLGLVEARLAAETGNSFLVLAHKGEAAAHTLWPESRAARYFSRERRPVFTSVATVDRFGDDVTVSRLPLIGDVVAPGRDAVVASSIAFVPGIDLIDRLRSATGSEARALVEGWRELAESAAERGALSFDFVPHNLRLTAAGSLAFIDDEWRATLASAEPVLRRGVLLTAVHLQRTGILPPWSAEAGIEVGADIALLLGSWVGLPADGAWIEPTIEAEAQLQVRVGQRGPVPTPAKLLAVREAIAEVLASPVGTAVPTAAEPAVAPPAADAAADAAALRRRLELGEAALVSLALTEKRTADRLTELMAEFEAHNERVELDTQARLRAAADAAEGTIRSLEDEIRNLTARLAASELGVRELKASTSWRLTAPVRAVRRLGQRDAR